MSDWLSRLIFRMLKGVALCLVILPSVAKANLLANGSFEDGTTSATVSGITNSFVPLSWDVNDPFVTLGGQDNLYNAVVTTAGSVPPGTHALRLGTSSAQPLIPTVSQTFVDQVNQTYVVSFFAYETVLLPSLLDVLVNNSSMLQLTDANNLTSFTQESFAFVGTGNDTLTFKAVNDPAYWFVDAVSVEAAPGPVPGAGLLSYLTLGLVGLCSASWNRWRKRVLALG